MTDVFDLALNTIFNDVNLRVRVKYNGGTVYTMLKVVGNEDIIFNEAMSRNIVITFEVLRSDIANPQRGDTLQVLNDSDVAIESYTVKAAKKKDESDRIWILDVNG